MEGIVRRARTKASNSSLRDFKHWTMDNENTGRLSEPPNRHPSPRARSTTTTLESYTIPGA
eukprot:2610916-Pyramimonas_sp.AAC.1